MTARHSKVLQRIADTDEAKRGGGGVTADHVRVGAVFEDDEGDMIRIESISASGEVYGVAGSFDFTRPSRAAAAAQLRKWKYEYTGQE